MTESARLALGFAVTGALFLAGTAIAAPAAPPWPQAVQAPSDPQERLRLQDQLHADLELAKLRAAIAKANAEAKSADASAVLGATGSAGAPTLPQFGSNSAMMNLPPLPGSPPSSKGKEKPKAEAASSTLVEVWGSGADRQAVLHSDAGDSLVRVGDRTSFGVITSIGAGSVSYQDTKGQTHTLD